MSNTIKDNQESRRQASETRTKQPIPASFLIGSGCLATNLKGTCFQNVTWLKWSEVAQSCPTLCDPVDCSPPGFSVHGILQARILEWIAISFSRGSSWPRNRTQVLLHCRQILSPTELWGQPYSHYWLQPKVLGFFWWVSSPLWVPFRSFCNTRGGRPDG